MGREATSQSQQGALGLCIFLSKPGVTECYKQGDDKLSLVTPKERCGHGMERGLGGAGGQNGEGSQVGLGGYQGRSGKNQWRVFLEWSFGFLVLLVLFNFVFSAGFPDRLDRIP